MCEPFHEPVPEFLPGQHILSPAPIKNILYKKKCYHISFYHYKSVFISWSQNFFLLIKKTKWAWRCRYKNIVFFIYIDWRNSNINKKKHVNKVVLTSYRSALWKTFLQIACILTKMFICYGARKFND